MSCGIYKIENKIKLKLYFEPVEDKPGYYWFNKSNYQIISKKTLMEAFKKYENNINEFKENA